MGLVARVVEEVGISTVYVGSVRDMMAQVKPPRPAFVNFPLGHQCGKPFDRELQMSIVKDALSTLTTLQEPGRITDLPYDGAKSSPMLPAEGSCRPIRNRPAVSRLAETAGSSQ